MTENITLEQTLTFRLHTCGDCGITYAMETRFYKQKLSDRTTFYCPNGHGRMFTGESDEEKAKRYKRLYDNAETRLTQAHDQLDAAERSRNAYKGQVTKIKRRVGKGVCPCCNRFFRELGAHMTDKHPDYAESGPAE